MRAQILPLMSVPLQHQLKHLTTCRADFLSWVHRKRQRRCLLFANQL